MFIEITGTNFQNKGAELMLAAIAEQCHARDGVNCVVQPWNGSYPQRAQFGLFQKMQYQRWGIAWHTFAGLIPQRLRRRYGLVLDSEIDVVLDASGFQFSDQWGAALCKQAAERFERMQRSGKRIVLLPQAFGPFHNPATRVGMLRILAACDMIFARDEESRQHLLHLKSDTEKIRFAPDFTNLYKVTALPTDPTRACILPNQRMLDKATPSTSALYLEFVIQSIVTIRQRGFDPFFLIHETTTDQPIVDQVNSRLQRPISVAKETKVARIKSLLGSCGLVVGSRYHGLISSLSQGVPSIATGWSHKYVHLMREYDCEDYFLDLADENVNQRLSNLLAPHKLLECRHRLTASAIQLKQQSNTMWSDVFCFTAFPTSNPQPLRINPTAGNRTWKGHAVLQKLQRIRNQQKLRTMFQSNIPSYLKDPFQFLIEENYRLAPAVQSQAELIERQREKMQQHDQQVSIYYSPKPQSSGTQATAELRPSHGDVMEFDLHRIASHTSISRYWGTFLHLLAESAKSRNILELGTCAGISGCYLSTASSCEKFWTIEGSQQLSAIATENLNAVTDNASVLHGLFDDVLDSFLPNLGTKKLDLVWIDGHHESVATIHYFQRLIPHLADNAIVLFDDISWSADMRQGWNQLAKWPGFRYTFDLKTLKGLGIWSGGSIEPRYEFIGKPFGRIRTGKPQGWN